MFRYIENISTAYDTHPSQAEFSGGCRREGPDSEESGQCHPVLRYPELWKGVEDAGAPRVPEGIWEAAAWAWPC